MAARCQSLGALYDAASGILSFAVFSRNATRIELCIFDVPSGAQERRVFPMERSGSIWTATVPLSDLAASGVSTVYYGYRAWGPNWPPHPSWRRGSSDGFLADVDNNGNRFNPNKLLIDPYAREISHDPPPRLSFVDPNEYADDFYTGDRFRDIDTGPVAPKGIVLADAGSPFPGEKPRRHLKDDVIYEAHLRGLTIADPQVPSPLRGTWKGAALKAPYLKELGVTAVEFLPVQAFANEQNDDGDPRGDNYWGYMALAYFAPNRRYSFDKSPGGPTREFREMVRVFHQHGIKVFIDVVYNHTAEGVLKRATEGNESRQEDTMQSPDEACLLSMRGLDNASYYVLRSNPVLDGGRTCTRYQDNSGCGGNLNVQEEAVRNLVIDSLRYWSQEMGVDGFRFDLAPILASGESRDRFRFDAGDPNNILNRAVLELPARSAETLEGTDLIAEPWALGEGTYHLGNFPDGWSEWNDVFRDTVRKVENKIGVEQVTPAEIANAISGSQQQFHRKGHPAPWHSINYVTSHDGHTLRDLFSCSADGRSWDHDGDLSLQRQAVRNALTLLMLSAGVPMIMAGDEFFRTLSGRTNTSAEDDDSVYLQWQGLDLAMHDFARNLIAFRHAHSALRPSRYFTGEVSVEGLRDLGWYGADGREVGEEYWMDAGRRYLGVRIDVRQERSSVSAIFIGYNYGVDGIGIRLPTNRGEERWRRVADTSCWMEPGGNWEEDGPVIEGEYDLHGRSIVLLVEREIQLQV